ncbi:MAG: VanW family protein [Candidatus Levybacteria bacterium]|nr:VanW family protein [Candidatus Levybacteria bacterium]
MLKELLIIIPIAIFFGAVQVEAYTGFVPGITLTKEVSNEQTLLAEQKLNLTNRYAEPYINDVFKDNILLNLAYMAGTVQNAGQINWDAVRAPSSYSFTLQPGEVFAYHDNVLPQYEGRVVQGTNTSFGAADGYRSSGLLYGDGVCHFASLINMTARDAGLEVVAPTNHDFAMIPDIDPMYGTAIYYAYGQPEINMQQNLYVENTFAVPVKVVFENTGDSLVVRIYK